MDKVLSSLRKHFEKKGSWEIFDIFPIGVSMATDASCEMIIHSSLSSSFLRIEPFNTFSHSAPEPPPVRVLHMDKELLAENMPIQRSALLGETIRGFELEFVWEDGISKTALWSSCPLYDENDAIVGALATCEDITHKKNTERKLALYQKQLEVSNAKLLVTDFQQHEIIDSITDGFFALDNEWRLIYINSLAEEFGFRKKDELLGKSLWDITPNAQPYYDQYHKSKRENVSVHFEAFATDTDRWVDVHAYPSTWGLSVYFRDITNEKKMQEELIRYDQFRLISQIAAGISHEIRNPMTTVRGYLQHLSLKANLDEYKSQFELMIEELDRANQIITEFLSLAKNKVVSLSPQDINHIIRNLTPLLEADGTYSDKSFATKLFPNPPLVLLDTNEIRQLIINLVRNGFEATGTGGKVRILTYLENDDMILVIEDNGSGIPDEVMKSIGMPFVTTKDSGTGLGLSICYSIVKRHNAKIDIETGDKGTTFYITFPIHNESKFNKH